MKSNEEQAAAKAMIKAVYKDGEAEMASGNVYKFLKMTHKKRRKVFAFMSKIGPMLQARDLSFIDWPEFESVEGVINDYVSFDNSTLSKLPNHWDDHPGDYVNFIMTALPVISYPFLPESLTD